MKLACHAMLLGLFASTVAAAPLPLRVNESGRFLEHSDGTSFFWVGDTAWELFHRLTREETDVYLRDRAAKGFNVVLAVALAEWNFDRPNAYGASPLFGDDPTKPNPAYFEHVDWVVNRASELGLYVGLLPTWGDKWNRKWGVGPEFFTPENAEVYGEWLGRRYREQPIVWILGGDRPIESERHYAIIRAMARGLRRGDGGAHLITFHPPRGGEAWFHHEAWLDFEIFQSGHRLHNVANYEHERELRAMLPTKPVLEGEPCYEDFQVREGPPGDRFNDFDVRKSAYWSVLSGGCGHTYGNHNIWQFFDPTRREAINGAGTPWRVALNQPGAVQIGHLARLFATLPWTTLVPCDDLLPDGTGTGANHIAAAIAGGGDFALIYTPTGTPLRLNLAKLRGPQVRGRWFNPRDGTWGTSADLARSSSVTVRPPEAGQDWLLRVDSSKS